MLFTLTLGASTAGAAGAREICGRAADGWGAISTGDRPTFRLSSARRTGPPSARRGCPCGAGAGVSGRLPAAGCSSSAPGSGSEARKGAPGVLPLAPSSAGATPAGWAGACLAAWTTARAGGAGGLTSEVSRDTAGSGFPAAGKGWGSGGCCCWLIAWNGAGRGSGAAVACPGAMPSRCGCAAGARAVNESDASRRLACATRGDSGPASWAPALVMAGG